MKEFFLHFFTPRESNNHRPHLLHHTSILLIIFSLLCIQFVSNVIKTKHPEVLGISYSITPEELLVLTNQKRTENGLAPLTFSGELANAAAAKGNDMLAKNYWAHNAPDGGTPWGFIKGSGYQYIYAGENLARGFTTSGDTVNAWMASPGHRENLLSPNYKEVGFSVFSGTLTGDETVVVVQMFGSRTSVQEVARIAPAAAVEEEPTIAPVVVIEQKPSISPPSPSPTPALIVASVKNEPLVNQKALTKNIALFVVLIFLLVLTVDIIIVERKKIIRLASHNIDHILFFSIIIIVILIITKGAIL